MSTYKPRVLIQVACTALGSLSGCVTQAGSDESVEARASVVWKGEIRETKGSSSVGMHASASHTVVQQGVKVIVDGSSEPLMYTARLGNLNEVAVGDRVRVKLWTHRVLLWQETDIVFLKKLNDAP